VLPGSGHLPTSSGKTVSPFYPHNPLPSITFFNLEKAVSRKARKERKGKSVGYLTLVPHLIGAGLYLYKYLNFFATLAPLRD
jgi:hypothetical protein